VERASEGVELSIGTARGNHLVLTDRAVSRHHCAISATEEGFFLRDLGSRNGTTLAGFRVTGAYLGPGAVLGVGESTIRFQPIADQIVEPLAPEERYSRLLGHSTAMRRIFAALPRIAASDSTVLIEGERLLNEFHAGVSERWRASESPSAVLFNMTPMKPRRTNASADALLAAPRSGLAPGF
jgi:pSer/pThr/pTyr-binding forkhead associated (FHA) protein